MRGAFLWEMDEGEGVVDEGGGEFDRGVEVRWKNEGTVRGRKTEV
jgi:hypothetical protein